MCEEHVQDDGRAAERTEHRSGLTERETQRPQARGTHQRAMDDRLKREGRVHLQFSF